MMDKLVVLGAGGHAKVVISALMESGVKIAGILDDDTKKIGKKILGIPVLGKLDLIETGEFSHAIIAIGNNKIRKEIAERYSKICSWLQVIHPFSYVHPTAKIGEGSVIFAGAVIQPDVIIGNHAIINTGACIDHDCKLSDYVHIGPGVKLAGSVEVNEGSFLGINSSVIPNVNIGKWCVIGAGAVVINNVYDGSTVAGVPARPVR